MNRSTRFTLVAGLMLALADQAWAAEDPAVYKQTRDVADATYASAKKACQSMAGNAKDICMAEAQAARDKSKATADAQHKGTPKAHLDARLVAAKADYKVAVERCDDKAGDEKNACVKEAKAARAKIEADAKASRESTEARQQAKRAKSMDKQ